jgi:hypothetical protein
MLLRDLLSKNWKRREWASISRSKSSLSFGVAGLRSACGADNYIRVNGSATARYRRICPSLTTADRLFFFDSFTS